MIEFTKFEKAVSKKARKRNEPLFSGAKKILNRCQIFGIYPHGLSFISDISVNEESKSKIETICIEFLCEESDCNDDLTYAWIGFNDYNQVELSYNNKDYQTTLDDEGIREFLNWLDPFYIRTNMSA